jgi:hypothetical protein
MKAKAPKRTTASKTPRKRKPDDPEQFERFVETAGKLGVDESGEAFERAFDKIIAPTKRRIHRQAVDQTPPLASFSQQSA